MFDANNFVPSLKELVDASDLDPSALRVALPEPGSETTTLVAGRNDILVSSGDKAAVWKVPSLRSLFRGDKIPPDLTKYPPEYVNMFYFVERHALLGCRVYGPKTDGEFEEWYSNLRRRPDGRSLGQMHDLIWQSLALLLGMRPTSQAEYEALTNRLSLSAAHFKMGFSSRNYADYVASMVSNV